VTRIGIVGAGAGAAAATFVLDEAVPDATITVLEKSGGVCGRAATRRRDGTTYRYDYGANYVKSDDERVTELLTETLDADGLVDASDPVWTFTADGDVSEGRDADEHKWSYTEGLTQIAKRLFARTDASVRRRTRIETIHRMADDDTWTVTDAAGDDHGPFDVLVLNPPAPQTAELLRAADWDDERRAALAAAVETVDYRSVWTAVLGYGFRIDRPYYALVNTDKEHAVGWISREECKRGHVPDGESVLIVQANHEWSVDRYDDPPAENVAALAERAAAILEDDRLADPDWTDHQGWRYALPESGPEAPGTFREATEAGLYCVGDWMAGEGRLHAALRNGLDTGEEIALSL